MAHNRPPSDPSLDSTSLTNESLITQSSPSIPPSPFNPAIYLPAGSEISSVQDGTSTDRNQPIPAHLINPAVAPIAISTSYIFPDQAPESSSDSVESPEPSNTPDIPIIPAHSTFTHQTRTMPSTTKTILDMPVPGTKHAPETFTGDPSKLSNFMMHYESLLEQCNVTSNIDRVKRLMLYCSKDVKATIRQLPHFQLPHWEKLKKSILHFYNVELAELTFVLDDVIQLTSWQHSKKISTLAKFKGYVLLFYKIAGYLKNTSCAITDAQFETYFWCGLPASLQKTLKSKFKAKRALEKLIQLKLHPGKPPEDNEESRKGIADPFPIEEVIEFGEEVY